MNLKKSLFGGYDKASVDALIEELNKKIDNLKEKESDLTDTVAHKTLEINNLSSKVEKMESEIEKLNAENSDLKAESNKSHLIFENVAKIYERAYGAGHNIVLDSKNHSKQMIDRMNQLFIDATNTVTETIAKQNNLKEELSLLYAKIGSLTTELTNNTDALFKGAEDYISVFDALKDIKTNTEEYAETHLKEFEGFTSEFLTAEEITKPQTVTVISNTDVTPPVIEEEQVISQTTDDEQVISPITESEEIIEPVALEVNEDITEKVEEISFSQPQETDETVLSNEDQPKEISSTIAEEEITAPTNTEFKVISSQEVNTPVEKPQETKTTAPTEQKDKPQEFTQFGRKSRVSSASREELIRKALLRNGGI